MSSFLVTGKRFEEAQARIKDLESRIELIEQGIELLEKEDAMLRRQLDKLTSENKELRERLEVSVLSSAKREVESKTDEMVKKAHEAVKEYLKPLTE